MLTTSLHIALTLLPIAQSDTKPAFKAKMKIADAVQGFTDYNYNLHGSLEWKEKGKSLRPKDRSQKASHKHLGIGCSTFVAVVLTRIRHGKDWLKHYDVDLYQKNGAGIAKEFGLGTPITLSVKDITSPAKAKANMAEGQLYLFDIERKAGSKWVGKHVGFVRRTKSGKLVHAQYSGIKRKTDDKHGGYHSGSFLPWLGRTGHGGKHRSVSRIRLYPVPQA